MSSAAERTVPPHPPTVPATLTREAAAAVDWHAIVIGAGPAGAAVAIRLARAGRRVVLVDRGAMPRPKVCGSCLSPRAVAELDALVPGGTGGWLAAAVALPVTAVRLVAGGRDARIAMAGGIVRSRESLDTALVREAIAAGAHWLPQTPVASIRRDSPRHDSPRHDSPRHDSPRHDGHRDAAADRRGAVDDGTAGGVIVGLGVSAHTATPPAATPPASAGQRCVTLRAQVAVIAAGLADAIRIESDDDIAGGHVDDGGRSHGDRPPDRPPAHRTGRGRRVEARSRIGVGAALVGPVFAASGDELLAPAAGELVMAVAAAGYCGLVTLEDGSVDLAAAVDRDLVARSGGPAGAVEAILAEAAGGHAAAGLMTAVEAATLRATPPLTHTAPLVCGDGKIFRVGDAAGYVEPFTGEGIGWALAGARLLAAALGGREPPAAAYAAAHAGLFSTARRRVWRVARGVRHPRLVAGAVRLAGMAPWMAAQAVPLITGATAAGRRIGPTGLVRGGDDC